MPHTSSNPHEAKTVALPESDLAQSEHTKISGLHNPGNAERPCGVALEPRGGRSGREAQDDRSGKISPAIWDAGTRVRCQSRRAANQDALEP
jgi:hypothetical protein